MNLSGNTILITGASSGIGWGLAESLYKLGNKVILVARRAERLKELSKKLDDSPFYQCDLNDEKARRELVSAVWGKYPETNVLINNAGVQSAEDFTKEIDLSASRAALETNVVAPMHLVSLSAESIAKNKNAAVINISSGLAFAPIAIAPLYCATKAALHSLSLTMRKQLAPMNIKVYEIAPPRVDTELGANWREANSVPHGGMSVEEFVKLSLKALISDREEIAIGDAENLREKREALFNIMNNR